MARTKINPEKYEIRAVDAWYDGDCWSYNETWHVRDVVIHGNNTRSNLLYMKRRSGYICRKGTCRMDCVDGSMYELVERKSGMPLMVFIPYTSVQ